MQPQVSGFSPHCEGIILQLHVLLLPDGSRIVSASLDKTVESGTPYQVRGPTVTRAFTSGHVNRLSPDGTRIISGSFENNIIWDVASGDQVLSKNQSVPFLPTKVIIGGSWM